MIYVLEGLRVSTDVEVAVFRIIDLPEEALFR